MKKEIGKTYQFCDQCDSCPIAIEAKIGRNSGLEIKDDYGGSVKLTDQNLKDLRKFLDERYGK